MADNPRYHWLGERPRWQALRVLARSRVLVLSSRTEGGANVLSEALAFGVPIVASRIAGSMGLLGEDYPGYFPVEGTTALARLLRKVEQDPHFYQALSVWCTRLCALRVSGPRVPGLGAARPRGRLRAWRNACQRAEGQRACVPCLP